MEPMEFCSSYKELATKNPNFGELLNKLNELIIQCGSNNLIEQFNNITKDDVKHFMINGTHFYDVSSIRYDKQNGTTRISHQYSISSEPLYQNGKWTCAPCITFNSSQISLMMLGKHDLPDVIYIDSLGTIKQSEFKENLDKILGYKDYDICDSLIKQGKTSNPNSIKSGDLLGFIRCLQPTNEKELRVLQSLNPIVSMLEKKGPIVTITQDDRGLLKQLLSRFQHNSNIIVNYDVKKY